MVRDGARCRVTFAELNKVRFGTVHPAVIAQRPFATVEAIAAASAHQYRWKFDTTSTAVCQYGGEVQAGAAIEPYGRQIHLQAEEQAVARHLSVRKAYTGFLPPNMQGAKEE